MNLNKLLIEFCKGKECTPQQIRGKSRRLEIVLLRHEFVQLAYEKVKSPTVVMRFLKRHPSTFYNSKEWFKQDFNR